MLRDSFFKGYLRTLSLPLTSQAGQNLPSLPFIAAGHVCPKCSVRGAVAVWVQVGSRYGLERRSTYPSRVFKSCVINGQKGH
jgi:hypothetical protein